MEQLTDEQAMETLEKMNELAITPPADSEAVKQLELSPLEKVEGAADFLIEIMPILFVPPTVSLIANVEALKQMLVPLFVISIVTTVLIMAVTGRVTQGIMRHDGKNRDSIGQKEEQQ